MNSILVTLFSLVIFLYSAVLHELSHGAAAYALGDPTAKREGRLSLNPLRHLDPVGSILLPLVLFLTGSPFLAGWAKPVPINPHNFKDSRWGSFKVAIAGPVSNFILAIFFGLFLRFLNANFSPPPEAVMAIFSFVVQINIMLALFNLIPIPPLDGHWMLFAFLPDSFWQVKQFLSQYGIFLLILLFVSGGLQFLAIFSQNIFVFLVGSM